MRSMSEVEHRSRFRGYAWGLICAMVGLVLGSWPSAAFAELSVSMATDRTQLAMNETLVLQVEVTSDSLQGPEISMPRLDDFEVLQQSVQKPMRFSFGLGGQQVQSSTIYRFVLQPHHEGRITIAAATAKQGKEQAKSKSIVVIVGTGAGAANPTPAAAADPAQPANDEAAAGQVVDHGSYVDAQQIDPNAFIRTVVDKSHPYEGEQITVTLYLYVRQRLQVPPTVDQEPSTEGLWTQDLLDGQTLEQVRPQQVGRARYNVYVLRRFAAFPLRPGPVTIGSMALTIEPSRSLFDMFGPGRAPQAAMERHSVVVPLEVKPLPEAGRPAGDVVVGNFTLDAKLDRSQTATGDAVTLSATLMGRGYIQGAHLAMPPVDGLEILAPQVHDLIDVQDDHVGGSKVFEWLLVPQKPGTYELPPLTLHTFDPASGKYADVQGPALTLTAAGQAVQAAQPSEEPPNSGDKPLLGDDEKPLMLAPVRTQSALLRKQTHLYTQRWFQMALLLPPLALLSMIGFDLVRRRARGRVPTSREVSLRESQRHLTEAQKFAAGGDSLRFFAEVAHTLHDALEHALGEPVGSFTHSELRKRLQVAGMEDMLATEVLGILQQCDAARFAPGEQTSAHLQETFAAAKRLQDHIQAWKPQPTGERS